MCENPRIGNFFIIRENGRRDVAISPDGNILHEEPYMFHVEKKLNIFAVNRIHKTIDVLREAKSMTEIDEYSSKKYKGVLCVYAAHTMINRINNELQHEEHSNLIIIMPRRNIPAGKTIIHNQISLNIKKLHVIMRLCFIHCISTFIKVANMYISNLDRYRILLEMNSTHKHLYYTYIVIICFINEHKKNVHHYCDIMSNKRNISVYMDEVKIIFNKIKKMSTELKTELYYLSTL